MAEPPSGRLPGSADRVVTEVTALRAELAEMRAELRAVSHEVEQLTRTFRSLATQLGIAAEPYHAPGKPSGDRDLPGFA